MQPATLLPRPRPALAGLAPILLLGAAVAAFSLLAIRTYRSSVAIHVPEAESPALHLLFEVANFGTALAYLTIAWLIFRGLLRHGAGTRPNALGIATGFIFLSCGAGHLAHVALTHFGAEGSYDTLVMTQIGADIFTLGVAVAFFGLRARYTLLTGGEAALIDMRDRLAEREAALRDVQAALATREQFLSVASHELRTPLTALKGHVQLARRRLERAGALPELDRDLTRVEAQAERLTSLINDLLDVSRIAAGRFVIEPATVELGPLVERVVELERGVAAPEQSITLSLPDEPVVVEADADRLEQVLVNLLENARKYSPAAMPVEVRVMAGEGRAQIAVQDHGIGIAAEEHGRIFEQFQRGANVDSNIAGLGLGLYIARQITLAHGGELTVSSTPGQGSTFAVSLPRAVTAAPSAAGAA
jgi:signal transduction histidine kinase